VSVALVTGGQWHRRVSRHGCARRLARWSPTLIRTASHRPECDAVCDTADEAAVGALIAEVMRGRLARCAGLQRGHQYPQADRAAGGVVGVIGTNLTSTFPLTRAGEAMLRCQGPW
jgi:hypothetical protein